MLIYLEKHNDGCGDSESWSDPGSKLILGLICGCLEKSAEEEKEAGAFSSFFCLEACVP